MHDAPFEDPRRVFSMLGPLAFLRFGDINPGVSTWVTGGMGRSGKSPDQINLYWTRGGVIYDIEVSRHFSEFEEEYW